jgi:invasion protein IalB
MKKFLLAAAALASLTGAAMAQAQMGAPETRQFGDFQVRCFPVQGGSPCDMFEQVRNRDTGQPLINFSIVFIPSSSRYLMVLGVPLGVSLQKGVGITSNAITSPIQMKFRRCNTEGCFVEVGLNEDVIQAFKKSSGEGKVILTADGEDKAREFPISFNGFTAAHDNMVEQNRAKSKPAVAAPAAAPAAP